MSEKLYLLRIAIRDIEPEIWRRFVVPADISLDRLHDVIQIVMGWAESHLHEFIIDKKNYTEMPESKDDGIEEDQFRLSDLVKEKGQTFVYHYDFGDDWQHDVVLEDNRYTNAGLMSLVECIDGERACPPEDIGGVPGYEELCRELSEMDDDGVAEEENGDDDFDEFDDEFDEEYDSEEFDIETVNNELLIYQRWARDRELTWSAT